MKPLLIAICLTLAFPVAEAESLWNRAAKRQNLFTDNRALEVGDIVTIVVSENAQASDEVSSETYRRQDIDAAITSFFNAGEKLFGTEEDGSIRYPKFGLNTTNRFQGDADHSRKSRVTAQISATVRAIEPNGNLLIEGRRTIFVDSERKNIIITGIIRPEDISPENTVESSTVADAEIIYEGFGPLSDGARVGIIGRILNLIPLF